MFSKQLLALLLVLASPLTAAPLQAAPHASLILLGNFVNPTYVTVAPGEPTLLFVAERAGRIQILRDEVRIPQPFLDIRDLVRGQPVDVDAGTEQGLLSIAFPPNYAQSGRFYVAFTNNNGDVEIDEFRRGAHPAQADRMQRRILMKIPHPNKTNHNGGQLQFGLHGLLYISVGDGGQSPAGEFARRLDNLLGKILRINPMPSAGRPYSVPNMNPFVGKPGRDEIFTYGLRNPWRFSIDGDRIAIADVGATMWEEVNFLPLNDARGANFGWPQYEGDALKDNSRPGPDPPIFPIFTYNHDNGRCAIIGGYLVRDSSLSLLRGRYLYGDACTGELRTFRPDVAGQQALGDRTTELSLPGLSSFGQGFNGTIYVAQLNGNVYRLAPP
jgi:glucose/arabinose dehydrogenase